METMTRVLYRELPATVKGMASWPTWSDRPVIIINTLLSEAERAETLEHKLRHLDRGDLFSSDPIESVER